MRDPDSGLEYSGDSLDTLFAQRKNLLSWPFINMIRDILRFNKDAVADLDSGAIVSGETLGVYLQRNRYGSKFIDQYLAAMGSAIWSADCATVLDFPVEFFLRFFKNHGLLSVTNRPQWRVIEGGSREYLQPLCASFSERIYTGNAVQTVRRSPGQGVTLSMADGQQLQFDQIVFACHSDQALKILERPSVAETEVLGAIPYQTNDVVLHTDTRLLPRNKKTWSSWNYTLGQSSDRSVVTYNMNILQGITAPETFCVTLNNTDAINPHKILGTFQYDHPVFSVQATAAQDRWDEINGVEDTWFCGAYWKNGFHEDGVVSALRVANAIGNRERAAA